MSITREQARVAAAALAPRVQSLRELLAAQIEHLPEGCGDWAETQEQLNTHASALETLLALGR